MIHTRWADTLFMPKSNTNLSIHISYLGFDALRVQWIRLDDIGE